MNFSGSYDFTYVKHEGQLVAQLNPDGTKLYVHGDHEGSSTVITNSSGQIIENTTYSPFGEVLSGGTASRFDSEGKEFDSVVGDYDFNFRKMNPSWGIFLQPDTLIQNVYDPQSLNRYMFERGNPYGKTDPTGHCLEDLCIGEAIAVGVAFLIGFGADYAYHYATDKQYSFNSAVKSGGIAALGAGIVVAGGLLAAIGGISAETAFTIKIGSYVASGLTANGLSNIRSGDPWNKKGQLAGTLSIFTEGFSSILPTPSLKIGERIINEFGSQTFTSLLSFAAQEADATKGKSGGGKCGINMDCSGDSKSKGSSKSSSPKPNGTVIPGGGKCGENVSCA